jgi:uncharacterized caspase-like protein
MRSNGNRSPLWRVAVLALLALCAGMVSANAQGRRLGLVIGLADYGETKHPTALQDAGLVAQSLRQARFELTEAANLTQTEFRSAFRDFQEKAAAAGPDAVVAIYVSGVGMQDDGENILIPVGARLRQRGDLGLEGLRVSDFLRSLAGVPASARIVMLDASYVHPFSQLVAEGGRGLAPVERREGMLVAYNQSPDQAAQLPRTNYGHYAMALAEALREPGIDLNAVFERVRMRVHDLSQGAETPYHLNGITAPVVLVQPTAEAPVAALPPETVEIQRKPIGELGADDAYARAVRTDTIPVYEEFIRAYPSHVQAKRIRAMIAQRREAYYWQRARRANTDRAYWTYLSRYPRGAHAGEAEARLARLSAPIAPPPQFEEVIYDDLPPPPPEEIEVYEAVVADDRWDVLPPPSGYSVHFLPPPPVEIIDLEPPPPNPSSRLLPAVVIGAGVIGAAILANRAWKRPPQVRPVVVPPVVRPPRPPRPPVVMPPGVGPGGRPPVGVLPPPGPGGSVVPPPVGVRPPVVQAPGGGQPPVGVRPPGTPGVGGGGVQPPVGQPPVGVRPPGTPGVGGGGVQPPVGQPPVGVRPPGTPGVGGGGVQPPVGQPPVGVRPPGTPGVGGSGVQPPRPGAIQPPPVGGTHSPGVGGAQPPRPGAIQPVPGGGARSGWTYPSDRRPSPACTSA